MSRLTEFFHRRDKPTASQQVLLSMPDAWSCLIGNGYRRFADCPEVQMCAHVYADMISSMTLHLMRNTDKGDIRVIDALSRKLDIEPNKLMTRKAWMYNIVYTMLIDGNQITVPTFTADGLLDELIPLNPSSMTIVDNPRGYDIRYGDKVLHSEEVLHFLVNPDPNRPHVGRGFSVPLSDVVRGLAQANATKRRLMESPAPSLIVKVDGLTEEFASPEGRKKLLETYIDNSGRGQPWIIPSEAFSVEQVKPLTLTDLAVSDSLNIDKRTVASLFGIPAYMVGVGEYKKDELNAFITTRVMPMAKGIEQELTRKLLYSPDLFWRFNSRSLYAYDMTEIIAAGKEMVDRMALRRNEWRDWLGFVPDDDMNELLALENYVPADRLGDQKKLNGGESNED